MSCVNDVVPTADYVNLGLDELLLVRCWLFSNTCSTDGLDHSGSCSLFEGHKMKIVPPKPIALMRGDNSVYAVLKRKRRVGSCWIAILANVERMLERITLANRLARSAIVRRLFQAQIITLEFAFANESHIARNR